jgi:glycosyltransferase involved in cell wall biosynthesis
MCARDRRRSAPVCLSDMRVCIVATEFLGVGASGGIGVGARVLGRHLAARGIEVRAIVPHGHQDLPSSPTLEGLSIRTYDRSDLRAFAREIRAAGADVYHHVQASLGARLAERAMADRAHVVECVDPRDWSDWLTDFRLPTHSAARLIPSFLYFGTWPAKLSARRADAVQVPARFLQAKVHRLYGLSATPQVVPMPFDASSTVEKSPSPLVVFVGRLVPRKRPELVIDLARRFPAVRFVVIGGGSGSNYAGALRRQAAALANLTFTDFIDQAADSRLFDYLSAAWILVNNAAREGLPLTFIEAAAHGCAILSASDPDGYASNFGYHVTDGDFARGMEWLLANENWRLAGERGHLHVAREHVSGDAIKSQLSVYDEALARAATRAARAFI